jgi:hypothetical protein
MIKVKIKPVAVANILILAGLIGVGDGFLLISRAVYLISQGSSAGIFSANQFGIRTGVNGIILLTGGLAPLIAMIAVAVAWPLRKEHGRSLRTWLSAWGSLQMVAVILTIMTTM